MNTSNFSLLLFFLYLHSINFRDKIYRIYDRKYDFDRNFLKFWVMHDSSYQYIHKSHGLWILFGLLNSEDDKRHHDSQYRGTVTVDFLESWLFKNFWKIFRKILCFNFWSRDLILNILDCHEKSEKIFWTLQFFKSHQMAKTDKVISKYIYFFDFLNFL